MKGGKVLEPAGRAYVYGESSLPQHKANGVRCSTQKIKEQVYSHAALQSPSIISKQYADANDDVRHNGENAVQNTSN